MMAGPAVQVPWPSQTRAFLTEAPSQVPAPQLAPGTRLRQAPLPSQVPSRPQPDGSDAGQVLASRGPEPAGTKAQTPGELGVLQDLQVPVQALLQHRPSTQKPLAQSPPQPQASPLALCMSPVLLQATDPRSGEPSTPPSDFAGLPLWPWQPASATARRIDTASAGMALRNRPGDGGLRRAALARAGSSGPSERPFLKTHGRPPECSSTRHTST
jgi:hypothetical protein